MIRVFISIAAPLLHHPIIETLIIRSTSDTNTDTNNKSCACAMLAKSQRRSVLDRHYEVRAILVVAGIIERYIYINPVQYYSFFR